MSKNGSIKIGGQTDDEVIIKKPSKIFTEYYSSIILILITMLVSAGYLVIKPKIDEYKDLRANSELLAKNAQTEETYLAGLRRSVAAAETIAPTVLTRVDRALPRSFSIPETLVMLNSAASVTNIKIVSVVFSSGAQKSDPKNKQSGLESMQLTLNVSAPSYQALKQFLNHLETNLQLIDVQMLTISDIKSDAANFSLQLRTYYYPGSSKQ